MKSNIVKHVNYRFLFCKRECFRNFCLFFVRQKDIDFRFGFYFRLVLIKLKLQGISSRLRNFCVFTGRLRSVLRLTGCSRCVFRTFFCQGILVGIRRYIW